MPSGLIDYVIDSLSVAASSASNLWMFNAPAHGGLAPAALRWNGKAWRLQKLQAWVIRVSPNLGYYAQAAVFGPNSVWVFGIGAGGNVNSSHLAAPLQRPYLDQGPAARRSMWATGDLAGPPSGHGSFGLVLKFTP